MFKRLDVPLHQSAGFSIDPKQNSGPVDMPKHSASVPETQGPPLPGRPEPPAEQHPASQKGDLSEATGYKMWDGNMMCMSIDEPIT